MRIKIATQYPLEKHFCWFPVDKKLENQAIDQLAKQIVKQLELEAEPVELDLLLEGCLLLPQTKIKTLLRDGDSITVKKVKATKKKRKSVEHEDGQEEPLRPVKKLKESTTSSPKEDKKLKKEQKRKAEEEQKKKKKAEEEQKRKAEEEQKKKAEEEEKKKAEKQKKRAEKEEKRKEREMKKKKEAEEKERLAKKQKEEEEKSKQQSTPSEGLSKTQKRNMRRRLLKEAYRHQPNPEKAVNDQQPQQQQQQQQQQVMPESSEIVEPRTIQPSQTLLKKNKNKKKHHLTDAKADNQFHIHYEDATWDQEDQVPLDKNMHGRAFVSFAESDPYYKGNPHQTEYPIHRVPTLFYAEQQPRDEPISSSPMQVDYDRLSDADFKSKIPAIGATLAIKTLELTANYTPEISEWKQVVLKGLQLPETITVEFNQGFYHNNTKGGKFDNKAHQRRDYDDYGYYEEEEEEEKEEQEEERVVTLSLDNVFAVKNMSQ